MRPSCATGSRKRPRRTSNHVRHQAFRVALLADPLPDRWRIASMKNSKDSLLPQTSFRSRDVERFWSHVKRTGPDECWLWTKSKVKFGHGLIRISKKLLVAHRVAFAITNAWLPEVVRHSCDVPACCNPRHLIAGTQLDNVKDRNVRKRQASGSRNGQSKFDWETVRRIRADPRGARLLAKEYGVNPSAISQIKSFKVWRIPE